MKQDKNNEEGISSIQVILDLNDIMNEQMSELWDWSYALGHSNDDFAQLIDLEFEELYRHMVSFYSRKAGSMTDKKFSKIEAIFANTTNEITSALGQMHESSIKHGFDNETALNSVADRAYIVKNQLKRNFWSTKKKSNRRFK